MKSDSPRTPSSNNRSCLLNPYTGWHIAKCPTHVLTNCYEVGVVSYLHFLETCPKTHRYKLMETGCNELCLIPKAGLSAAPPLHCFASLSLSFSG